MVPLAVPPSAPCGSRVGSLFWRGSFSAFVGLPSSPPPYGHVLTLGRSSIDLRRRRRRPAAPCNAEPRPARLRARAAVGPAKARQGLPQACLRPAPAGRWKGQASVVAAALSFSHYTFLPSTPATRDAPATTPSPTRPRSRTSWVDSAPPRRRARGAASGTCTRYALFKSSAPRKHVIPLL